MQFQTLLRRRHAFGENHAVAQAQTGNQGRHLRDPPDRDEHRPRGRRHLVVAVLGVQPAGPSRLEVNLRSLALAFAETFPDAKITVSNGKLSGREAKMPEFKDHAIVDRAVSYTGGNATLFVYDDASNQFVSPHHQREEGERRPRRRHSARARSIRQAPLRRAEAYKGPAVLFGKSFMTAYYSRDEPVREGDRHHLCRHRRWRSSRMLAQAMQTMAIAPHRRVL